MIKANYHMHSVFCDGTDTPEDIAAYAYSHGLTHLGFSGHMDAWHEMDTASYYSRVRSLQDRYRGKMDILRGIEMDNLYSTSCLYDAEFWIGSTHFMNVDSEEPMAVDASVGMTEDLCRRFFGGDYYKLAKAYYDFSAEIFDRTGCTFVGHFDLVARFNDEGRFLDEEDVRYLGPAMEAMKYLVSEGVPFEINTGAINRGWKKQVFPHPRLLKALREFGGEIVICSDAHRKEDVCGSFAEAVRVARMCGFTHTNILEHAEHDEDRHGTDRRGISSKVRWKQVPLDLLGL